ncbi:MAG: histidine--tRNA ligase [Dehalococcoidales bacterium]|nr:histidine--tRNA ligase [Dehalococcoidales bacterium]
MYQAPRGTADILPEEQAYWRYIEQKVEAICRLYGYERIDTPVFEDAGLFIRSVGEGTDIVEKEMYTFKDRGDSQITLRPEGTAPVCRAYLEHGMPNLVQPVKLFYLAPIYRYERPQAGRYREHHQFGCEAIGEADPALDAEVIDMAWQFFISLGLNNFSLQINSIGCKTCRPEYIKALCEYYNGYRDRVCAECRTRLERNALRLLDCKKPDCRQVAAGAPSSVDYLCPDCAAHFNRLTSYLKVMGLPFNINPCLVRGLDYYTRTVFEIQPDVEGAQSTLGGGGRYDVLIEELGGKPTPGIGFGAGIERMILNLKRQQVAVPPLAKPGVFIACLGEAAKAEAVRQAALLRKKGIGVLMSLGEKSLKAQLRQSNTIGVGYTVILGENELQTGTAVIRNMASAQQETVPLNKLPEHLRL